MGAGEGGIPPATPPGSLRVRVLQPRAFLVVCKAAFQLKRSLHSLHRTVMNDADPVTRIYDVYFTELDL